MIIKQTLEHNSSCSKNNTHETNCEIVNTLLNREKDLKKQIKILKNALENAEGELRNIDAHMSERLEAADIAKQALQAVQTESEEL